MKTVEMPKMGDTMEEGKILRWLKQEGNTIKKGEPIAEIETEKVNIEIEAFASGTLRKILIPEGSSAPVGAAIAFIGAADEPLPSQTTSTANQENGPVGNAGIEKANLLKPDVTVPLSLPTESYNTAESKDRRVFISPIARRVAEEHQLDYSRIKGTGPNGRIIKLDVEAALAARKDGYDTTPMQQPTESDRVTLPLSASQLKETDEVIEVPLSAMRRTIAKRLSQSMQQAPHIYVTSVIDTGKLSQLRQQINDYAAKDPSPVKVSYNDLIVKAVAQALTRIPEVNVSFAEDRLLLKRQIHIGVAVALEQGLIVPVVRNANQRNVLDLARETQRLTGLARSGKLRPEEISGGTFTVSNLGMFDVESFTAVINPPESAILAVGSITPTPVVLDGEVVVRDRMKVTLSADHRSIDGATAARFLQEVKRLLEEPFGLLL